MSAESRVAFIIRGVVKQAMRDARLEHVKVVGSEDRRELVRRWCDVDIADNAPGAALLLDTATKTELLLGQIRPANLYPFGDLYASELADLAGVSGLSPEVRPIADRAGGIARLDQVLRRLLDERRDPNEAFDEVADARTEVMQCLEQTRFFRMQMGIVPKIGARTVGIDLFV